MVLYKSIDKISLRSVISCIFNRVKNRKDIYNNKPLVWEEQLRGFVGCQTSNQFNMHFPEFAMC